MRARVTALVVALLLVLGAAPAVADVTLPPAGVRFDYQLGGPRPVGPRVGLVVRDRAADPLEGRYNVCYVNAFQTQPGARAFWRDRPGLVLRRDGAPVRDDAWGEWLLDIRTAAKRERLARIVGRWIAGCAEDGFDAAELDNLDSFTRSGGLLRRRHAVAFARLLVERGHAAGLAVAQKNLAGWDGTTVGFDLAVAEECGRYDECGDYAAAYGRRVLVVEYRAKDLRRTCRDWGDQLSVVLRDRDVTPTGVRRWCRRP